MTAPQRKALTNPQRELLDIFLRLTREKEPVSHEEFNRFSKELRSGGFDYSHLNRGIKKRAIGGNITGLV
jgi:hypothetical protein